MALAKYCCLKCDLRFHWTLYLDSKPHVPKCPKCQAEQKLTESGGEDIDTPVILLGSNW